MRSHRPAILAIPAAIGLAAALLAAPLAATAGVLDIPFTALPGASAVPACDDPSVLADVQARFAAGAADMLLSDLTLHDVDKVRQTHPLAGKPSALTRRYCAGRGHISNGRTAPVYFLVEQRLGFAGQGWLVTSCVNGYDRWRVHDGDCRAVRRWW